MHSSISVSTGVPVIVSEYFEPLRLDGDRSFLEAAQAIERAAKIESHPFFSIASSDRQALVLWAGQEAVVTNPFSQLLLRVISSIKNVHVRSILMPVVHGEHSPVRDGIAERSHPWLIWRLCRSLGISDVIQPTRAVVEFIGVLEQACTNPMRALGTFGVGNELMLLAEYRAVEACFDAAASDADYREFLRANIEEDEGHTKLIERAALALQALGFSGDVYLAGAREGVAARVAYYDALISEIR
jgi:hypothetical protein